MEEDVSIPVPGKVYDTRLISRIKTSEAYFDLST